MRRLHLGTRPESAPGPVDAIGRYHQLIGTCLITASTETDPLPDIEMNKRKAKF